MAPDLHLRAWAPGNGQAGQGLELAQARANDQPALGGGAAAQACLSPGPDTERKWGRKQGAVAAAVQSNGLWVAETACEEPGAAIWCPLSYRAGRRYGVLDGQVRADEQALSTDLGLATGGSEPPLAFHFLGEFSELSGLGGNRTGIWRAQKAVGAGWWSSGRAPCPPTAIFPVMMSVFQKHRRSEISPDPTSPWPPKHPSRGSGQDTGVVLPASRVPGPGGLKWAPTLGWRHLWQTP